MFGAVAFDDPRVAGAGWSSDNGGTAKRIRNVSDLASNTLWITNLSYYNHRRLNLHQTPHIFNAQFMRTSFTHLANEIGLGAKPDNAVEAMSAIFSRVYALGDHFFKAVIDGPAYRYSSILSDVTMPSHLLKLPEGKHAIEILDAIKQSTQENQSMVGERAPKGSKAYTYAFPRSAYARWLLTQDVPIGHDWKELALRGGETVIGTQGATPIKGSRTVINRLSELAEKYAILLEIDVQSINKQRKGIASFSAGANYPRRWAALPEVLALSRFSKIAISGGFMVKKDRLQLQKQLDLIPEQDYSFSRGLFLENLWVSLVQPRGEHFTALGAYLRAYDRMACLKAAEAFVDSGFVVGSYGSGRVVVFLRRGQFKSVNRLALEQGLLPPLSLKEDRS